MKCYVIQISEINGGNVVSNEGELATVRFKSATHDVLVYAAPRHGMYVCAHALIADNIENAVAAGVAALSTVREDNS